MSNIKQNKATLDELICLLPSKYDPEALGKISRMEISF